MTRRIGIVVLAGLLPACDRPLIEPEAPSVRVDPVFSILGPATQLSAGTDYTCAIDRTGHVDCWGRNHLEQAVSPEGAFVHVSAGSFHTCAVRSDGAAVCWGSNGSGQATPPAAHDFVQVDAGAFHTCGLRSDGTIVCWGWNGDGEATAPEGTFTRVSAGTRYTCGLRSDATLSCWGATGGMSEPAGTFTQVSAGDGHACAIRSDETAVCWGRNDSGQAAAPSGSFIQVSAGALHSCGVRSDGSVACWGHNGNGRSNAPTGAFTQVTAGGVHSCALRWDGTIACWGLNDGNQTNLLTGEFVQVAPGFRHVCGVRTDRTLACWPDQPSVPAGTFSQVTVGFDHACALRTEGTVVCWGDNTWGQASAPTGVFTYISAGNRYACGVKADGFVACWGQDWWGQSRPPAVTFTQVSAFTNRTCGVRTQGTLACWSISNSAPAGTFLHVSNGFSHSCALRSDGTIACWGENNFQGQLNAPAGTFLQVSAGDFYNCALRPDGKAVCWGWNAGGRLLPPERTFTELNVGQQYACGLTPDRTIECWGNETTTTFIAGELPSGATPPGTNIQVRPTDPNTGEPGAASITFAAVTAAGTTRLSTGTPGDGGSERTPLHYRLGHPAVVHHISTTATYAGPVDVCIDYSAVAYGTESLLRLLQYNSTSSEWTDVTTNADVSNQTICGTATSLSSFLVAERNEAPDVTSMTLPNAAAPAGERIEVLARFTDANSADVHSATITWGDGHSTPATVISGSVTAGHSYDTPGIYTVVVTVSDGDLAGVRASSADEPAYVAVYEPLAGYIMGTGRIQSEAGWCTFDSACELASGEGSFNFIARYVGQAHSLEGNVQLRVPGLHFKSLELDWLAVASPKAHLRGRGWVNDLAGYEFLLTIDDGADGIDRMRIRIWQTADGLVVYDSQSGELASARASTVIAEGTITIK